VLLKSESKLITDSFDKQFSNSIFNFIGFVDSNFSINRIVDSKYTWVNSYSKLKLSKTTTSYFLKVSIKFLLNL
jgi:hypothetical protein